MKKPNQIIINGTRLRVYQEDECDATAAVFIKDMDDCECEDRNDCGCSTGAMLFEKDAKKVVAYLNKFIAYSKYNKKAAYYKLKLQDLRDEIE